MSFNTSKVKEEIDSSTNITTENKQVTASEGSIAVGEGARVSIESLDAEVLSRGFDSIDTIASGAQIVNIEALNTVKESNKSALDFGSQALVAVTDNSKDVSNTLGQANALLARSFEQSANVLQRSTGVDDSTIVSEQQAGFTKIALATILLLGVGFIVIKKKGGKA